MSNKVWIDISVGRGPVIGSKKSNVGMTVKIYADAAVEDFMKSLSNGKVTPVDLLGQQWVSLNGKPLEVYNTPKFQLSSNRYSLDLPGRGLTTNPADEGLRLAIQAQQKTVNLSFLRLVGISNPDGITFGISGVYSREYITEFNKLAMAEAKQFLVDYITPVTVNLRITQS